MAVLVDMHFYGVYALARAAGIKPETAYTIVYASQFVDDAFEEEKALLGNQQVEFPIGGSHKPMDHQNRIRLDQWNVWIPFHFLPGNPQSGDSFHEKMQCLKATESKMAEKVLEHALSFKSKPYGSHLAGITAHVYADTFAHFGFVGLSADWNRVEPRSIRPTASYPGEIMEDITKDLGDFADRARGTPDETAPVGHGAVATCPDRPYLRWEYRREQDRKLIARNNPEDYLTACEGLYNFFIAFVTDNPAHGSPNPRGFDHIRETIRAIIEKEGNKKERIDEWKAAIEHNRFFQATEDEERIEYNQNDWNHYRSNEHLDRHQPQDDSHTSHFIHAARKHRDYVLYDLLAGR